jgi:WD40 repeat protein
MLQLDPLLRHPITSLRMMNGRERRQWILSAIPHLLRLVNSSWCHAAATKPLALGIGLHRLLKRWRQQRDTTHQSSPWLRNLRPPLDQLGAGQVSVLRGHIKPVTCVSVVPNSRMLISGSEDNTIRVWDVGNSQEIAVLTGHEDAVQSIAVAPDGSRFFSGSWDGTLRAWDLATLQSTCTVKGHENWVKSVALSPCGKWIVTGSLDHTLKVWGAHDLKHMATLRGHEEPVTSVVISPDGQFIYSGSRDETVRVWRLPGGEKVSVLRWPSHIFTCIAVSELFPNYVACGATDGRGLGVGSVSLWDVPSQKMICQGSCPGSDIYAVTFSPSGKEVLSGSLDKAVRRWSISERFKSSNVVWDRASNGVWSLCFLPDENRFAAGSSDGIIRILSNQDVGSSPRPMGHRRWIEELTFNVHAKQLVTRNFSPNDDPLFVWDIKTGLPVRGSIVHDGEEKTASRSGNDFAEIVVHLDGMKPLFYAAALNPFMSLADAKTYAGAEGGHLHILNIEFPAI